MTKKSVFEWNVLNENDELLGVISAYSKYHAKSVAKVQFKTTNFSVKRKVG